MIHTLPLLLALPGGPAPECAAPPALVSPLMVAPRDITEDVQAAIKAYDEAYSAWIEKLRAAAEDEREALYGERPSPGATCAKLLELAGTEPASAGAFEAWRWVASSGSDQQAAQAASSLAQHHLENEALEAMAKGSPHTATQGCAWYALAKILAGSGETARAEEITKVVIAKYGDVEVYGGRRKLGPMAEGMLFEATRLQIGMQTPDIDGEDVDGVSFKLSDYRGKVVMLDFWGDW
jgi:hypothetical protein